MKSKSSTFFVSLIMISTLGTVVACALYYGLRSFFHHSPFACPFYRCWPYWDWYPFPYLVALSVSLALVSSVWLVYISPRYMKYQRIQIAVLPILALLLAGLVSGLIWTYHDMREGYFPGLSLAAYYMKSMAFSGLFNAPLVAVYSFPLNILGWLASYSIVAITKERLSANIR